MVLRVMDCSGLMIGNITVLLNIGQEFGKEFGKGYGHICFFPVYWWRL
jgi:hypothetical protein